jgi:hypothetical protein
MQLRPVPQFFQAADRSASRANSRPRSPYRLIGESGVERKPLGPGLTRLGSCPRGDTRLPRGARSARSPQDGEGGHALEREQLPRLGRGLLASTRGWCEPRLAVAPAFDRVLLGQREYALSGSESSQTPDAPVSLRTEHDPNPRRPLKLLARAEGGFVPRQAVQAR